MYKTPKVSVIVLNWNGKRFIDKFIQSYSSQTYPTNSTELIFVDNASSDDSVSYFISKYKDIPNVTILKNDKNYGYAEGNNKGMRVATGKYVLICNNDLILDRHLISNLVTCSEKNNAAMSVPKLMYFNKPKYINNAGSTLNPEQSWPFHEIGKDEVDEGQYDETKEISAICGACVLISRKFLSNVGMFDSKFFMYFEDGDLSWRGQKAGYKYFIEPKAVAYHYHTGSSKEGSPLFNFYVGRNRLLVLAKNAKFLVWLKATLATIKIHFLYRIKNIMLAIYKRRLVRNETIEFLRSSRMILSAILLTPYALAKRWKIIKEDII